MNNKRVKQMICGVWEFSHPSGVYGVYGYSFGVYRCSINPLVTNKYGLCFDGHEMKCGQISLTANQLKGK